MTALAVACILAALAGLFVGAAWVRLDQFLAAERERAADTKGREFDARVAEALAVCGEDPRSSSPIFHDLSVERLRDDIAAFERGEVEL